MFSNLKRQSVELCLSHIVLTVPPNHQSKSYFHRRRDDFCLFLVANVTLQMIKNLFNSDLIQFWDFFRFICWFSVWLFDNWSIIGVIDNSNKELLMVSMIIKPHLNFSNSGTALSYCVKLNIHQGTIFPVGAHVCDWHYRQTIVYSWGLMHIKHHTPENLVTLIFLRLFRLEICSLFMHINN